jgi:1,4-alpha-glucan branching enzyme
VPSDDLPGEVDRHLFAEGRHHRLWELLGGHPDDDGARFAVWAPNARSVSVLGDWNHWSEDPQDALALRPVEDLGIWVGRDDRARAGHAYKYLVEDRSGRRTQRADPVAAAAEVPPATASVLWRSAHRWAGGDDGWRERRAQRNAGRTSIYEVHLGSWRRHPDGRPHGYRELADSLPAWVAGLGFTHVEFLPVATHPFAGSWGYQVTGYYAPDARLGSPDDLRVLVEACHDAGLGVLLDWVPAHFPRDPWALARFDGTALYEHEDPRRGEHPDWGTLVFNHGRREVRNFLVANAAYWLEEFRVDGLRVDAVASMLYRDYSRRPGEWVPNEQGGREDLEAIEFVRELDVVVARDHPGALVVAEESTSWPGVTAPVEHGGLGFGRKWNLGWMHDTLTYFGRDPVHRAHHHHDLTFPMVYAAHERWILPLSHDEVVHGKGSLLRRMPGDDWQRTANLRALLAWQWCHPGRQLLFMGAELAQEREWSHDRELDWWLLERPLHEGVRRLVGDLNHLQSQVPALWEGDDDPATWWWLDADDREQSVFSFARRTDGDPERFAVVVANLTPVPRPGYRLGVPVAGEWEVSLTTDDAVYGGSGHDPSEGPVTAETTTPWQGQPASLLLSLPPLAVVVLEPQAVDRSGVAT